MNLSCSWKACISLFAICLAAVVAAPAQTFTSLNSSNASWGPLVQGIDGNLYGTEYAGGTDGYGSVFKITPEGALSTVHTFDAKAGGNYPTGLAVGLNGNLYGTTKQGGATGAPCPTPVAGCGTIFELTATGATSVLHEFIGTDGMYPVAGLTLGPDGNFYGTTNGTIQKGATGATYGTVFKLNSVTGALTTLHSFSFTDGAYPASGLVLGANGLLYGSTTEGGEYGDGTVFDISTAGTFTTIHNFNGHTDGGPPIGSLVQATNGNFYGATLTGPTSDSVNDYGTIFSISPGGVQFQVLYSFTTKSDASYPAGGLVLGADGNLYGATSGLFDEVWQNDATLFQITPKGGLTTLHTFPYSSAGVGYVTGGPYLMQATNGTFYGTTNQHVSNAQADVEVFSLSTGLGSFITTVPQMRGTGAKVLILGQGLTGATSVTFNGVSAEFTVDSDTEITATVPTGATKGYVKVVTPGGTLSTTVVFYIP
jgi:uncharacterized repeat protein (TIGR03803 family)